MPFPDTQSRHDFAGRPGNRASPSPDIPSVLPAWRTGRSRCPKVVPPTSSYSPNNVTDEAGPDVLHRAKAGERAAFEQLIGPLIEPGYHIAFAIMRDRHEAEDAVQEAALTAWRKIGQLREESSVRSWFFKIVVNRSRMQQRRSWTSVIKLPAVELAARWSEERTARRLDLRSAVRELAENDRLLLFLHYGLDLPLQEVAPVVGLTPAGTKTRLYRVLKRLRPLLAESEGYLPWK